MRNIPKMLCVSVLCITGVQAQSLKPAIDIPIQQTYAEGKGDLPNPFNLCRPESLVVPGPTLQQSPGATDNVYRWPTLRSL